MPRVMNPTTAVKADIAYHYDQYLGASKRYETALERSTNRFALGDGSKEELDIARHQVYETLLRHLWDGGVDMDNLNDVRNNAARLLQSAADGYIPMDLLLAQVDSIFAPRSNPR